MDLVPPLASPTIVWQPNRAPLKPAWPLPELLPALLRGLSCKCPACGKTRLFTGYLRVADSCADCNAPLGSIRADDAPPYFTIFIVGHIVVPGMFLLDRAYEPSDLVQAAIWLPVTAILALALLRPIKDATVGLMLRLGLSKAGPDA